MLFLTKIPTLKHQTNTTNKHIKQPFAFHSIFLNEFYKLT